MRSRQSSKAIPAGESTVALGSWLSRESDLSRGPLWPWGATQPFRVTDEAAVPLLTFLSNFASQSRLPWNPGRALVARRPRLALHDAIGVAGLSRRSWGPGGTRGSIPSTGSWQGCARKALVAFFSSLAREAGSTSLAWHSKAWGARLALDPWKPFRAWLSSEARRSWEASLSFLS